MGAFNPNSPSPAGALLQRAPAVHYRRLFTATCVNYVQASALAEHVPGDPCR